MNNDTLQGIVPHHAHLKLVPPIMIDHISLLVSDLDRSKRFFGQALAPLGYELLMEHDISGAGFGRAQKPDFWLKTGEPAAKIHVAFAAEDRATVDRFFSSAIEAGGRDNGGPGPRTEYHPSYYGAFVLDPDGNNIEAVCHLAE